MTTLLVSHVAVSLVAIFSGFVISYAFLIGKRHEAWTALFLVTTIATSASGFLFPNTHVTPGQVVGAISLAVLAVAVATRNSERNVKAWSKTYIVSSLLAFYLNFFVLVVQLFGKVPELKALAPTQSEPPFVITQLVVMAGFLALGYFSIRRSRKLEYQAVRRIVQLATA